MAEYFKEILIDWEKLDDLILKKLNCKQIAKILNIHPTTLTHKIYNKYGKLFTHYSSSLLMQRKKNYN